MFLTTCCCSARLGLCSATLACCRGPQTGVAVEIAMHDLDAPRMDAVSPVARSRTERHLFAFSGIAFEVLADPRARFQLPDTYLEHLDDGGHGPVLAKVICSACSDPARQAAARVGDERALTFRHSGPHTQILSSIMLAEISEVGLGKYAAAARIAPNSSSASALVFGMASAIVQRHGGLNLHAAAIELDGRAVLFLGPSGAGKSTAAGLSGAPVFANDRVCVAPDDAGQFWAFSLPGGEPVAGASRSERRALPLAGCFRVRQAPQGATPALRVSSGVSGLFALREAASSGDCGPTAENDLLQSIQRLCEQVPTFELHTVLDVPIAALLRAGLQAAGGHDALA
jgi:hypothetical protein